MNKETLDLLQKLADRLGTTVDHLWSILIKQAPISGLTSLIEVVVLIIIVLWGFSFVKKKTTEGPCDKDGSRDFADWDDEGAGFAWILWGLFTIGSIVFIFNEVSGIVCAFFNPEYWAFKQVF